MRLKYLGDIVDICRKPLANIGGQQKREHRSCRCMQWLYLSVGAEVGTGRRTPYLDTSTIRAVDIEQAWSAFKYNWVFSPCSFSMVSLLVLIVVSQSSQC